MNNILELKNINFGYSDYDIFENMSFCVKRGEFLGIVGSNGAGKSTLMKIMTGELPPKSGEINFDGDVKIAYVQQMSASISNYFPITVREVVSLSLYSEIKKFSKIDGKNEKKIDDVLKLVGIFEKKYDLFGSLSGGQKQKVMLAKAIISNPDILLLDEPLIGLDSTSKENFINLLKSECRKNKLTIIMISHDFEELEDVADRILKIDNGKLETI